MATTHILCIIPARGGSKRVKNKNLLPVGDTPLVTLAVDAATTTDLILGERTSLTCVVSTDDPSIRAVAPIGTPIHLRETVPDEQTVDEMIADVVESMEWVGPVMVMQPTSVPEASVVADMIQRWVASGADTYTVTVTPMSGLYWNRYRKPLYDKRANTQQLGPVVLKENGAVRLYPAGDQDYGRIPDRTVELPVVDIDTWGDLQQVRSQHNRGEVVFSIVATTKTGAGHLYRCMSIAQELQHHDVSFHAWNVDGWAVDLLKEHGWRVSTTEEPRWARNAVWVNDRLDTNLEGVASRIKGGWKVVNIEDQGPGARYADLVINAMYPTCLSRSVTGPDWAVIRPEFMLGEWELDLSSQTVMVLFGGTDPKDLTYQIVDTLAADGNINPIVMTGPGYDGAYQGRTFDGSVAEAMSYSDLLVTSGGRTVYEAAAFGIPTVVIAQNLREVTHSHLGPSNGNLYLGLADTVSADTISEAIHGLMLFPEPRVEMSERSKRLVDGKGVRRIVRRIEDLLEGL